MTVRPKILIFSLAYHPFVGGAEVAIKEITDRLGDDFSFDMITANLDGKQKKEERVGNINVYRIGRSKLCKYLFPFVAYFKAKKLHEKNNYDMIWAMMANQAGWAALKFKNKFPSVKYLLTLQEGDSGWDIWWRTFFIRLIYKNIYRRADHIQAISNFLAERAKKLGAKNKIEVVPNGVKSEWLTQLGCTDIVEMKSNWKDSVQESGLGKIITFSRLEKKNGIEYLIRAMKDINGRLIILGDGRLKRYLESITKELSLEDKVKFEGFVNQNEFHNFIAGSDVFCRPSLSEGLGNSFLEAMAFKLPVIATPVGGIPDFLHDGETGWFCKVKDPKSIAQKINYVLDPKNKEEVEMVVDNARKMVEEKYNWNNISESMRKIFNQLTNQL